MKAKMDIDTLLSDDLELLLREINEFCGSNAARMEDEIPQPLENYLQYVAKTGNTIFPWHEVRPLFKHKLNTAIGQFHGEPSSVEPCVHERFDLFRSAPFTIQRLAELILQPQKHYKTKEKFVCALEKTVFVVSTVEPRGPEEDVSNGKDDDLDDEHEHEQDEPMTDVEFSSMGLLGSGVDSVVGVGDAEWPMTHAVMPNLDSVVGVGSTVEPKDPQEEISNGKEGDLGHEHEHSEPMHDVGEFPSLGLLDSGMDSVVAQWPSTRAVMSNLDSVVSTEAPSSSTVMSHLDSVVGEQPPSSTVLSNWDSVVTGEEPSSSSVMSNLDSAVGAGGDSEWPPSNMVMSHVDTVVGGGGGEEPPTEHVMSNMESASGDGEWPPASTVMSNLDSVVDREEPSSHNVMSNLDSEVSTGGEETTSPAVSKRDSDVAAEGDIQWPPSNTVMPNIDSVVDTGGEEASSDTVMSDLDSVVKTNVGEAESPVDPSPAPAVAPEPTVDSNADTVKDEQSFE
jgi:serine/threonine-protein phosphatase 4 regulatory subunit 2